nr:ankyrin repeat-containing protein [Tanacetum cinerariifolium]
MVRIKIPAEDGSNEAGLGKLRDATREGNWWRAQSILKKHKIELTTKINKVEETMLHLAVGEGKNYFVQMLLDSIQNEELIEEKNIKGQTALHIAALVGNRYAAELLVKKINNLLYVKDNLGKEPLVTAYSNNQISTFAYLLEVTKKPGELLSKHRDSFDEFIVRLIYRKEYDLAFRFYKMCLKSQKSPTDKVLMAITRNFPSDCSFWEALIYPSWENVGQKVVKRSSSLFYSFKYMYARAERILWRMKRFKNNYYRWLLPEIVMLLLVPIAVLYLLSQWILLFILVLLLPFYMLYTLLWKVLATVVPPIKEIEKRKKEYREANFFLDNAVLHIDSCKLDNKEFYKSIAFEAVRLDVYELAIIHRSDKVYNRIFYPLIKQKEPYRTLKDYSGNNLLHLVGRLAPSHELSCTTGAALQLQRELQWREEVKKFMEPMQLTDKNIDNETPEEVFTREHKILMKDGETWMKKTAESCSITAALIVTIVFAAAITVPGGSNQETGIPLFKKQIAFTIFAISDAISLFSASTSLLVFLSILTTRFAEKDFLLSLPRRLLIALCLLFLSTSAMMLAFSAILFLVFCEQRPWMLAPIGVFTCMPITAIVSLQLPLVVDLYRSTYSSMFVKGNINISISKASHSQPRTKKELEEYMHASNVNLSNYVSVKLSSHSNYPIWKAQMLSLLDKLMIRDIVENRENWFKSKGEDFVKKYDILLKGWILGSLSEEVLRHVDYSACAHCVWVTLSGYPT